MANFIEQIAAKGQW